MSNTDTFHDAKAEPTVRLKNYVNEMQEAAHGKSMQFSREDLNLPPDQWVLYNTVWDHKSPTHENSSVKRGRKCEMLGQVLDLSTFTRSAFGESNYQFLVKEWYRAPMGGGLVPPKQVSFHVREMAMFNDYLLMV